MMTELEASGEAIATALNGAWAKDNADAAVKHLQKLMKAGKIDAETFGNAVIRVSGNHSAMRQDLVRMGLIALEEKSSALKTAIKAAMDRLANEALESITSPEKPKKQ